MRGFSTQSALGISRDMTFPSLYVLRHGQTLWNAEHRIQGSLDSALTDLGRTQAHDQNDILRGLDLHGYRAVSSPQGRALETARLALDGVLPDFETDARLREIGVGDWEGRRRDDIDPATVVDESEENALYLYESAPGGEGFAALRARCEAFLSALNCPSVLVTHGITSRMLRLVVLGLDTQEIGTLPGGQGVVFHLENGVQRKLSKGA
jgi:probable phosphoglycerate mutase